MFQNSNVIDVTSIPDGKSVDDLISIMKLHQSTGIASMDSSVPVGTWPAINQLKADTIFENLGDILALERIKPNQYFQLKAMLNSSDTETAQLARSIILRNLQHV